MSPVWCITKSFRPETVLTPSSLAGPAFGRPEDGLQPPGNGEMGRRLRPEDEKASSTNPALGAICFALLMFFAGTAAAATQEGNQAMANWKAMDLCAKRAQAAFPDFTADSNAKRDAKLKECLSGANLPPRQPEMPAQPR
jgi:hypothetical protein